MTANKKDRSGETENERLPAADTGNASNPSPHKENESDGNNQLLGKGAEKYLRETASIEDLPDARDQEDMEESFKKENKD